MIYIVSLVYNHAVDKRNLMNVYEEVTKVVNETLRKDEINSELAVEFSTSEVPGREGNHGRRYQFVQRDIVPSETLV